MSSENGEHLTIYNVDLLLAADSSRKSLATSSMMGGAKYYASVGSKDPLNLRLSTSTHSTLHDGEKK